MVFCEKNTVLLFSRKKILYFSLDLRSFFNQLLIQFFHSAGSAIIGLTVHNFLLIHTKEIKMTRSALLAALLALALTACGEKPAEEAPAVEAPAAEAPAAETPAAETPVEAAPAEAAPAEAAPAEAAPAEEAK